MQPLRRILPSGLEVLIAPRSGAKVVSIQVYVWAGSLHEEASEHGAAHFIEHMLFKGTKKRGVGVIGSLVEGAGGDINAYTTFDRTVFYLTLPSVDVRLGLDVLADAVLGSTFDPAELEREREVVLEEIRRGNDDPGALVGKKIFTLMYPGTPAARPIIGSEQSVGVMSRQDLIGYYERNYRQGNMSVVVVGDVSAEESLKYIDEFFSSGIISVDPEKSRATFDLSFQKAGGTAVIRGEYAQTRIEIAFPGPSVSELDGIYVDLAAYIFGGSEISRLQRRLRDRDGVVSAIGCSAYSPSFRGVVEISAAVDPEYILKAAHAIGRELGLFLSSEPADDLDVARAAAAFRINRIHRDETVDGVAKAYGQCLATPLKEKFEDTYEQFVNGATANDVMEGIRRTLDTQQVGIVALGHRDLVLTESELLISFKNGWAEGLGEVAVKPVGTALARSKIPAVTKIELDNGTTVIYRHLPDAKMFCMMAATEGGLRFENTDRAGLFHATAGMLGLATKTRPYEDFTGRLEDTGSVISGFSGKDSCGWELHTIVEHAPETIKMWGDAFQNPVVPEEQWLSQQRETLHSFKMQLDSGAYRCMRLLAEGVYGKHPYAGPVLGWPETIEGYKATDLQSFYHDWRDSGSWLIAAAGGLPTDILIEKLNLGLRGFRKNARRAPGKTQLLAPRKVASDLSALMDKEQSHLAIAWRGISWNDPDRAVLDVLMGILGGHGGRLFVKLRDQQSLAYTVSPLSHPGFEPGLVGAYIACKPEKTTQARAGLALEFELISTTLVGQDELDRAKQHLIGSHEIGLQRTSSQAMTMCLMELYGIGWSDFERYPDAVSRVSREDVKRLSQRLFLTSKPSEVLVGTADK
ncbi:MAG: pitrilysin family protein [Proteobacteria bacterium]|nr:pitrilysin family protein [Pseudomonadota bacterium]